MTGKVDRRTLIQGAAALAAATGVSGFENAAQALSGLAGAELGPSQAFSFALLQKRAEALAAAPFAPAVVPSPQVLDEITYDQYQQIRYRRDKTVKFSRAARTPVQFFHLGKYAREPVKMFVVDRDKANEVIFSDSLFDIPQGHPARQLPAGAGFAGFRVMAPDLKTDWFAAMGASYFRTSGPFDQYGLSARGVAVDTAMPAPEEFPRFSEYWISGASSDGRSPLTIYALLDGPSVAGAYMMRIKRQTNARGVHRIDMEIDAHLWARKDVTRLGIAPFSSMYWYGKANRKQATDWRPQIHDSDGLAILTGSGERIWRPINNPPRVMTSTFVDHDVKGFGLLQRDRAFADYLDDGVFYNRRPSVWVEPREGWGAGAVQLVEIPTDDETSDNIVAYWTPDKPFKAGEYGLWRYRLSWLDDIYLPKTLGHSIGTWSGMAGRPGHKRPEGSRKYVVDFEGAVFNGLGREDGVEFVLTTSRGEVSNSYNHPVVSQPGRWRALFDIRAEGAEPVDMRGYLRKGDRALTETWIYQYFPEA